MTRGTKHDHTTGDRLLEGDPWQVGGYRILRRLGEGGMGVVYLAEGPSRTQVAVKVIHRHLASDPDFRRRFRREVTATRRVARFSTAPVIDADVDGHTAYLVTEYVPGPTLLQAVHTRGPLTGSALEGLAASMAVALRAIHAADVIHRDLKPSNVLLSAVGPKVIDFGLAYLRDSSTHSIAVMGTPAYMSPEHVRGLEISGASDIFSWAGVVAFAACGHGPFGAGAGHEVLYRVVHDKPRLPELGGALGELVAGALSKDPADRPTAAQIVDRLTSGAASDLTVGLVPGPARSHDPIRHAPAKAATSGRGGAARRAFAGGSGRGRATWSALTGGGTSWARRSRRWTLVAGTAVALATAGVVVASQTGLVFQRPPIPGLAAGGAYDGASPATDATSPRSRTGTPWAGGDARTAPAAERIARGNPLRGGDDVRFFTQPDTDAARQARTWSAQGRTADAGLMRALSQVPQAMWLGGGDPRDVTRVVREASTSARRQGTLPVFVTDHIPGRDCFNGGAENPQAYRAWIDAVAEGIGDRPAVVALEPGGLARAPGTTQCARGGEAAADQRYGDLSYAVANLGDLPHTAVYLDGGLDGWPAVTEMADRLVNAGVARADGFYVNMSGYRPTDRSLGYGTRMSKCLHLKITSATTACTTAELAAVPDGAPGLPHFLIDTSRNGTGEWNPPAGTFRVPDEWCNPPGRGTGVRPSTETGSPVADAFLWLNSPGYSNGRCSRGGPGPADPVYGFVTPASGQWWPDLALDRVRNAAPPLTPGGS